jgi:hypothetical protein
MIKFSRGRESLRLGVVALLMLLAVPVPPGYRATAARGLEVEAQISGLTAKTTEQGTLLEWRSSATNENLGFDVYRIDDGRRVKLNREVVPGGVFTRPESLPLGSGSFAFLDRSGKSDSVYVVEAISTTGERSAAAPIKADSHGTLKSNLIGSLTVAGPKQSSGDSSSYPVATQEPSSAVGSLEDQWAIAAQLALKIDIKRDGWYRVTYAQSASAGFNPVTDIRNLRLYGEGQEVAILTSKPGGQFSSGDYFEFFGRGLDIATSGRRTYYLVAGTQPGKRIRGELHINAEPSTQPANFLIKTPTSEWSQSKWFSFILKFVTGLNTEFPTRSDPRPDVIGKLEPTPVAPKKTARKKKKNSRKARREFSHAIAPAAVNSFTYTVERKDRLIYFSFPLNGDTENYFGEVLSVSPLSQQITVPNPDLNAVGPARLEVALQGVGTVQHQVDVSFNNSTLGNLSYFGLSRPVKTFDIPLSLLNSGTNTVTFTSTVPGTVSLIDYVRLTYPHALRADNNSLRLNLRPSQAVRVEGFATENIHIIDVTDPFTPRIATPLAQPSNGAFAFDIPAALSTSKSRVLYAQPTTQFDTPDRFSLNQPSTLSAAANGADLVIIAHKNVLSSLAPLVSLRQSQGVIVSVIDVEDIYDEFSFGVHGPEAIKSFLMRATSTWTRAPRYVLLVGDASSDPRDYQGFGELDMVPTKLVDATFNETASDDWISDFNNDGVPEIPIGRLPVRNLSEANLAISKIVSFAPAAVPQSALLVADDPTNFYFNFEGANDEVQALLPPSIGVQRVNRRTDPDPRSSVISRLNAGQALVNYTGHGNVDTWMGSSVFASADAARLTNAVSVVISQVYGGGGDAGATLRNDFVELFNRGTWPVRLGGWSLQYGAASGTTWQVTNLPDVVIPPGKYFLVQQAQGSGGTTALPSPDAQGTVDLNATAGKIALVNTTSPLSGNGCPTSINVVDLVGYGGANCSLGSPATSLTTTTVALRGAFGCTDTRSNSADFSAAAPIPRNGASPANNCINASAHLPLSFVVVMDCLNGYFQDPVLQGLAEAFLNAPNGGAVAVFASSGLTVPDGQHAMATQLYTLLYGSESVPLGDAVKVAKAATTDMDVRRTWILFGDPSMRIR